MDIEDISLKKSSKEGFLGYVFNFNDESKGEICNIAQYSVIAIIPIILLIKSIQSIFPEPDEDKSSIELTAEVVFQTVFMFLGIFIIHRIICYIPTYSKLVYHDFNVTSIILATLVIVLSLQTRLGEKSNILYLRMIDMIQGNNKLKQQEAMQSQETNDGQQNIILPPSPIATQSQPSQQQIQQNINNIVPNSAPGMPTHDNMNGNHNQMMSGDNGGFGLLAANEALGGSFGSAF